MYPEHGVGFVGLVMGTFAKGTGLVMHVTLDATVDVVHGTGILGGLLQIAVDNGEH